MRVVLFISIILSASLSHSLIMNEAHPKSGLTNLNKSHLNLRGDIKKATISGFGIVERHQHKFIKTSLTMTYHFKENGNITSLITDGEFKTKKTYTYKNNLITKYTTYRSNYNDSSKSLIKEMSSDIHYKDGKIYGLISDHGESSGCLKYSHSKNTVKRIDCNKKSKIIYSYHNNGNLKSIHTSTDLVEFKNTYTHKPNTTIIEKTVKDIIKSITTISKDDNGNIIEVFTKFIDPKHSMSIIPTTHLSNTVTYNILKTDKYGNPLETLITATDIYEDTSKNTKKERKEFIEYEYYN